MSKHFLFYALIAVVLLALILLFTIPSFTKVNLTLNATKIDTNGNAVETIPIYIQGYKIDYKFRKDRLDVSITPFDNLTSIKASTDADTNTDGIIHFDSSREYYIVYYGCVDVSSHHTVFATLGFSPNMDRWIFVNNSDSTIYVASASGNTADQELMQYFSELIPPQNKQ